MTENSAIKPVCRSCGLPINDPSHINWNGHAYHNDHLPSFEPPPGFEVVEVQPDSDAPGLWIGFKSFSDRDRAMGWFHPTPRGGE